MACLVPMRSNRRLRGLSHGNNTAALPPMLLGDFETAQRAQSAVMAFQPPQPEIAQHLARRTRAPSSSERKDQ
ncbi:hypothetical protein LH991_04145 [Schleiferilactobacillus harbinensis]|uniref:Uncharacterized protein n=1 Tax=Schleiferilactobacillus harbinensis TaxID=304207 RepID=A0A5P8Q187_9LACO|nr:hypothetical protein D1010_16235 [Schleiferilactobacillus harbinensis]QFR63223.1 hypothetical protein LH991_04145 [Schleiferilactobacillus harbinensis]